MVVEELSQYLVGRLAVDRDIRERTIVLFIIQMTIVKWRIRRRRIRVYPVEIVVYDGIRDVFVVEGLLLLLLM